jgi:hypothetical protein
MNRVGEKWSPLEGEDKVAKKTEIIMSRLEF